MGDPHETSFRTPLESCLRSYISQNISNEYEPTTHGKSGGATVTDTTVELPKLAKPRTALREP